MSHRLLPQYVSFQEPSHADQCRILAIPSKRYERRLIEHLKPEEKVAPSDMPPGRFRPDDELLAFLEGL